MQQTRTGEIMLQGSAANKHLALHEKCTAPGMCLESKVQESLARTCRCFKVQSQAEQNLRTARHLKEPFGRLGSQVLGSGGAWGAMAHKSNPYKKAGKWKCTSGDIML